MVVSLSAMALISVLRSGWLFHLQSDVAVGGGEEEVGVGEGKMILNVNPPELVIES